MLIPASDAGLPKDSVVNVSRVITVDRAFLIEKCGQVPPALMRMVDEGSRLALYLDQEMEVAVQVLNQGALV